jgi:hypothetical protein
MASPELKLFVNQEVRALAQVLYRALTLADRLQRSFDGKEIEVELALPENWRTAPDPTAIPAGEIIDDGRGPEGLSQLSQGDIARWYRAASVIRGMGAANGDYLIKLATKAAPQLD